MLRAALQARKTSLVNKFQLPERFKGTIVENWARYWRGLLLDYKEVFSGAVKTARDKPAKSAVYAGLAGILTAAIRLNPRKEEYRAALIQMRDEVAMVSPSVRNHAALDYVNELEKLHNENRIRHISLGLFSLYWVADFSEDSALPATHCEFLQPAWLDWHKRIIEIAFWGTFWQLEKHLADFDVNPDEWSVDRQ